MKGRCLCGAVRFNLTGTPTPFDLCYCSRCREASGSAFLAELEFNAPEFEWVSGQSLVKTYEAPVLKTPPGYRRTFCTLCGAPVPTVDRDIIRVPAGSLDMILEFGRGVTSSSTLRPPGLRSPTLFTNMERNQERLSLRNRGNFGYSETGSLETASSSGESGELATSGHLLAHMDAAEIDIQVPP